MGDVVSLVERAAESIQQEDADKLAKRMAAGKFDLNDLRGQLQQMQRMGGLGMLAGMIPGLKKAQAQMTNAGVNDKTLIHLDALISSMTPKERERPEVLNAKRKIRVAKGAGLQVQDVNRLLKMHKEMEGAMKRIKKMGGLKGLAKMFTGGGGGGGLGGLLGGAGAGGAGGQGDLSGLKGLPGMKDMPNLPPGFQNFLKK